ncbi:flagellar biosynthetic protein FliQ [Azospirillum oleiclasticum]|nr:flagellar biosynthetic protein FliQ [Azospirillum oleiclasticum]
MMGIDEAIGVTHEALMVIMHLTMPILLVTTAIGMVLTIFQSVTHINETTLQQDLKIFVTLLMLFIGAPLLYDALRDYTLVVFDRINAMAPPP